MVQINCVFSTNPILTLPVGAPLVEGALFRKGLKELKAALIEAADKRADIKPHPR
jgi:hypothetical protein